MSGEKALNIEYLISRTLAIHSPNLSIIEIHSRIEYLEERGTLLMFTAWLQLDYRKILCNFCLLEITRGPNGKCFK